MQSILPRTGDRLIGRPGAILNGAVVLRNWVSNGGYWTNSGAPAQNTPAAIFSCQIPGAACTYPQDLYLNNVPLTHQLALPIVSGQWYFDYANDVIYMADDPIGQTVELSVTRMAIGGAANNVTVQGLMVEKYAAHLQDGAIQPEGSGWVIQNNQVLLNNGEGIKTHGNNEQILSNIVNENSELGIGAGRGSGDIIKFNTVSYNNFAKIHFGIEMGGCKFAATINTRVLNNTVSNNNGNAIWIDGQSTGAVIRNNRVTFNYKDGIRYEFSHYGTISNNTLINNDQDPTTGVCASLHNGHEITVVASDHVSVTSNNITSQCGGVSLGGFQPNEFVVPVDDIVTDNTITYTLSVAMADPMGGWDSEVGAKSPLFDPANNDYFDYNTYNFNSSSLLKLPNWMWGGVVNAGVATGTKNWFQWRAIGQDTHSTVNY